MSLSGKNLSEETTFRYLNVMAVKTSSVYTQHCVQPLMNRLTRMCFDRSFLLVVVSVVSLRVELWLDCVYASMEWGGTPTELIVSSKILGARDFGQRLHQ